MNTHNLQVTSELSEITYWCFISYRHADNKTQDREWATWLHQEIERYEIPAELVGTRNKQGNVIPERIYPVFRDEESLSADADLEHSISHALDQSRFLVILCSPQAVESNYVAQEVLHFKKSGKEEHIIAAILSGEPNDPKENCFPKPLIHPVSKDGSLDTSQRVEPIAADFRLPNGMEGFISAEAYRLVLAKDTTITDRQARSHANAYAQQLSLMKLKILAGILGVPLEKLRNRDKAYQLQLAQRRNRILWRWLAAIILLALLFLGTAFIADLFRKEANIQRDEAFKNYGEGLLERAKNARSNKDYASSAMLAGQAIGFEGYGGREYKEELQGYIFPYIKREHSYEYAKAQELIHGARSRRVFLKLDDLVTKPTLPIWAKKMVSREHQAAIIQFSPSGRYLIVSFLKKPIQLWDIATDTLVRQYSADLSHLGDSFHFGIQSVAMSHDESLLAAVDSLGVIHRWRFNGTPLPKLTRKQVSIRNAVYPQLDFGPSAILSMATQQEITLWDADKGTLLQEFETAKPEHSLAPNSGGVSLAMSLDGTKLATSVAGVTQILNLPKGTSVHIPMGNTSQADVTFHPNKQYLAFTLEDAIVVTTTTGKIQRMVSIPGARQVTYTPDGAYLIAAGTDKLVKIDTETGLIVSHVPIDTLSFSLAPDGRSVAAITRYGNLVMWNLNTSNRLWNLPAQGNHPSPWQTDVQVLSFNPANQSFATGDTNGNINVYRMPYGELSASTNIGSPVQALTFSSDGIQLAILNNEGFLSLWDFNEDAQPVAQSQVHDRGLFKELKFAGKDWLVTAGQLADVRMLRIWKLSPSLTLHHEIPFKGYSIPFDVHGEKDQLVYWDGTSIQISSISQPQTVHIFKNSTPSQVERLKFSPSGEILAVGGSQHLEVWNLASGKQLLNYNVEDKQDSNKGSSIWFQETQSLTFDKSENYLLSCSRDYLCIWDLKSGECKSQVPLSRVQGSGRVFPVSCGILGDQTVWSDAQGEVSFANWSDLLETPLDLAKYIRDKWISIHMTGVSFNLGENAKTGWQHVSSNTHISILRSKHDDPVIKTQKLFWHYLRVQNWNASALLLAEIEDDRQVAVSAWLRELGEACRRDDLFSSGAFSKYWKNEIKRHLSDKDLKLRANTYFSGKK